MRNVLPERESGRLAVKLNTVARKMLKHLHTATAATITATAPEKGDSTRTSARTSLKVNIFRNIECITALPQF